MTQLECYLELEKLAYYYMGLGNELVLEALRDAMDRVHLKLSDEERAFLDKRTADVQEFLKPFYEYWDFKE